MTEGRKDLLDNGSEMPDGWIFANLKDVCTYIKGKKPKSLVSKAMEGYYPYILVDQIDGKNPEFFANDSSCPMCTKDDVLIVWDGSIGKNSVGLEGVIGSTIASLTHHEGIVPKYLRYFIQYKQPILQTKSRGTGLQHINPMVFWNLLLPLAPYQEQHRIVAKIEELLTKLDVGLNELEKAGNQLIYYRKTILNAAIKGDITSNWRCSVFIDEIVPASALLEHALKERRECWNEQHLAKLRAKGKIPNNDRRKAGYKESANPETNNLPTLPSNWSWATVQQLASSHPNSITDGPFGSNLKTAHYTESGPRVIRLQNVGDGVFIDEYAHISQRHFESLKKHHIKGGDIVIAILGKPLPRACIVPSSVGPALVKADCIRFSPNTNIVVPEYLNYALNAETTRRRVSRIVHGVGRPRLNLGEIKSIPIPVPPLPEQKRIVVEVERRLSILRDTEKIVDENLNRVRRLRQSILKVAFEGRLVPQDPTDEPAEKLLKRIRAERTKSREEKDAKKRRKNKLKQLELSTYVK